MAIEIEFGTYVAPAKVNPYAELMAAFVTASDANPNASYTLTVPALSALTEEHKFRRAANDANRTASLKLTETTGDGKKTPEMVSMTFTLTKRHKPRNVKRSAE